MIPVLSIGLSFLISGWVEEIGSSPETEKGLGLDHVPSEFLGAVAALYFDKSLRGAGFGGRLFATLSASFFDINLVFSSIMPPTQRNYHKGT